MYSVSELSKLAGVSVRTLHYYHEIELLVPCSRSEGKYRQYDEAALYRLQQILFYKEMGLSLSEIGRILSDPDFDLLSALKEHRDWIKRKEENLRNLLNTVNRTIARIEKEEKMLSDKELYEGFTQEEATEMRKEAGEMFGENEVHQTEAKIRKFSKTQWQKLKQEETQICKDLVEVMHLDVSDLEVQKLVTRHHLWIENFYPCSWFRYQGLAQLYVEHEGFKKHYDSHAEGLAEFLSEAMSRYAEEELARE